MSRGGGAQARDRHRQGWRASGASTAAHVEARDGAAVAGAQGRVGLRQGRIQDVDARRPGGCGIVGAVDGVELLGAVLRAVVSTNRNAGCDLRGEAQASISNARLTASM